MYFSIKLQPLSKGNAIMHKGLLGKFFLSTTIITLTTSMVLAAAKTETFKVDTAKSSVDWKGSKVLVKTVHNGQLSIKEGSLEIKDNKLVGGKIVVDMNSLTDKDLESNPEYHAKLLKHLKSDDFFNAEKYPTSTLVIKSVETKSATDVVLKGDLTIRDQTQAIEVPAKVKIEKTSATGEATIKLDRTKWGLKYGSGQFFKDLGDKVISDEFELAVKIEAKK